MPGYSHSRNNCEKQRSGTHGTRMRGAGPGDVNDIFCANGEPWQRQDRCIMCVGRGKIRVVL